MDPETIEFSSPELYVKVEPELLQEFPVVDEESPYEQFFARFIAGNVPCLIRVESLTSGWCSSADWASSGGKNCNVDFFLKILPPDLKVPVADCDSKYFNSQEKLELTLDEYVKYWHGRRHDQQTASRCLYLKDWHFRRDCPKYSGNWPIGNLITYDS